jgi:DNA-binding transcriptional ArsR family regulator
MSTEPLPPETRPGPPRDLGADPLAMRALAHPVRIRLLEELTFRGPLTATQAADHVGESPSTCSFHLRTLAKYGFVEEAGGGTGRQRPWRVVSLGNRWRTGPDTEATIRTAGEALAAQVRRRDQELFDDYRAHQDELPAEWTEAVIHANFGGWLTADELAEIGARLIETWQPYLDRLRDPSARPPGSRLVHMFAHGFPRAETAGVTDEEDAGA